MAHVEIREQQSSPPIVIEQLKLTKGVGVGGGIIMALAGVMFVWAGTVIRPGWPWYAFGVLAFVFGVVVAVRIPGSCVVLTADTAIVKGQLWSRTIPRRAITSITPWPFIKWTDSRGRKRSTPVSVLNARNAMPKFADHAAEGRKQLHDWAGVGGDYLDPNGGR